MFGGIALIISVLIMALRSQLAVALVEKDSTGKMYWKLQLRMRLSFLLV